MPEFRDIEQGDPIDQPPVYRTLVFAFFVWSAHFIVSYCAILVLPEQRIARVIAIVAGAAALAALLWQVRKLLSSNSPMALGALALACAGIVFGTFPAIIG